MYDTTHKSEILIAILIDGFIVERLKTNEYYDWCSKASIELLLTHEARYVYSDDSPVPRVSIKAARKKGL